MGTSDWGHYYSIINNSNEWMEFNDTIVRKYDISNIK